MNYNYPPGLEGVGPYWEDEKPSILEKQYISPRTRRKNYEAIKKGNKANNSESNKNNR